MNVAEAVASRRTIREFLDRPVPFETVRRIMDQARMAPSGCNFQPWEAVVLTGSALTALQERLAGAPRDDPPEYDFLAPAGLPRYKARWEAFGDKSNAALGIARDDAARRAAQSRRNFTSFGAPVLLLCHFPKLMKEAQWSDVGMWLQTIMLLARGEGLDTCPQEFMGMYGRSIKAHLGLPEDHMLFCGLAIGWRAPDAPINNYERDRVPLDRQVRFVGFG